MAEDDEGTITWRPGPGLHVNRFTPVTGHRRLGVIDRARGDCRGRRNHADVHGVAFGDRGEPFTGRAARDVRYFGFTQFGWNFLPAISFSSHSADHDDFAGTSACEW